MSKKPIMAVAVFDTGKIKGVVRFIEDLKNNNVVISINISGLKKTGFMDFMFMKQVI